jgi:hypothetical protein
MYWYISDDKLRFSAEDLSRWRDRLEGKLQLGIPTTGAGLEVGLARPPDPSLADLAGRLDREVTQKRLATDPEQASSGKPPALFWFEGFGARLLEDGAFWVAGASRTTAFLLVGSASNTVGANNPVPAGSVLSRRVSNASAGRGRRLSWVGML